jgi:hypothetical protein
LFEDGQHEIKTRASENVESISVEDFAAFITTNTRYINFNGETGAWGIRDRRVER